MSNKIVVQPWSNGSQPIRVLMTDPDELLLSVYQEPLSQDGFEMSTALSGLECIAHLREHTPDVLVLEPQLLWGGGDGILAIMGEIPALFNVPVMVLTSSHDPQVLGCVSHFPISDYQIKPLMPHLLAGRLRALLKYPRLHFLLAEQNGRLECSIARRTSGRVHDLRVESIRGRVIVHGRSGSHHVAQLALAAVLEAFQASRSQPGTVEMDIDVAD